MTGGFVPNGMRENLLEESSLPTTEPARKHVALELKRRELALMGSDGTAALSVKPAAIFNATEISDLVRSSDFKGETHRFS